MKKILLCIVLVFALPWQLMAAKTLILIGDATMAPHSIANPDVRGWGEKLSEFFTDKVEIVNFAQAGESTHTLVDKRLQKILEQDGSGDFVILQVGQNDLREEYGNMYYSASEMVEQLLGVVETLHSKRMKVILCTPIAHPFYLDGQVVNRMGGYSEMIRRVAKLKKTYLLDLEDLTMNWLNNIGSENAQLYFKHVSNDTQRKEYLLTEAGATEVSRIAAKEIVAQKIPYLSKQVILTLAD